MGKRDWSAVFAMLLLSGMPATAERLPVETFYKALQYPQMVLSPSGRYLAALYPANGATNLAVVDRSAQTARPVTAFATPDAVLYVGWASDERLVYQVRETDDYGNDIFNLAAVDRDGKNPLYLLNNHTPTDGYYIQEDIVDWLPDDPDHVLLRSPVENHTHPAVYKVSIRSGRQQTMSGRRQNKTVFPTFRSRVVAAPARKCDYVTDNAGVVRSCLSHEPDDTFQLLYRSSGDGNWITLKSGMTTKSLLIPIGFSPDGRTMYAFSNEERDTTALYEFDPAANARGRLLFEAPGTSLDEPLWSADGRRLLGVTYETDRPQVHYIDPQSRRLHQELSRSFQGEDVRIVNYTLDQRMAIVLASSERTPGRFYLYDDSKKEVAIIADRASWIDPKQMSSVKPVNYRSRDGREVAGRLALPIGRAARNLPAVVYPEGGPFRASEADTLHSGWDKHSQFLASRGYAVLKIDLPRWRNAAAGDAAKDWVAQSQNDIADGVKWAIEQGLVDKGRLCIIGRSFGGHAALMALATAPDLYRCGISYAGIADLDTLFEPTVRTTRIVRRRSSEHFAEMEDMLGGRDTKNLRQRSPLYLAAAIRAPVFLAHGQQDLVVSYDNATRMRNALEQAGKTVELFTAVEEGHGFARDANEIELFRQVEAFLDKHNPAD